MDASPADLTDYDALLRANAARVFSEPDAAARLRAIAELWTDDPILHEKEATIAGAEAISASIGALLARLPPDTLFVPIAPAAGHHGVGKLLWRAETGGVPGPVTGTDIAVIRDGRIATLYVFVDAPA